MIIVAGTRIMWPEDIIPEASTSATCRMGWDRLLHMLAILPIDYRYDESSLDLRDTCLLTVRLGLEWQ